MPDTILGIGERSVIQMENTALKQLTSQSSRKIRRKENELYIMLMVGLKEKKTQQRRDKSRGRDRENNGPLRQDDQEGLSEKVILN